MRIGKKFMAITGLLACMIPTVVSAAPIIRTAGWAKETETHSISVNETEKTYTLWSYGQKDEYGTVRWLNNEWAKIGGQWYYFTELDDIYHFASYGRMATNEYINGYWFNKNGTWTYKARASWKHNKSGWWYGDTKGWYAKNQWLKIDGEDYYFNTKGYMVTGWQKIGNKWYYFKSNGQMAAHETLKIKGTEYYFFGDGTYNNY